MYTHFDFTLFCFYTHSNFAPVWIFCPFRFNTLSEFAPILFLHPHWVCTCMNFIPILFFTPEFANILFLHRSDCTPTLSLHLNEFYTHFVFTPKPILILHQFWLNTHSDYTPILILHLVLEVLLEFLLNTSQKHTVHTVHQWHLKRFVFKLGFLES